MLTDQGLSKYSLQEVLFGNTGLIVSIVIGVILLLRIILNGYYVMIWVLFG